jgi:peptide/nickel transport system permease protein
MVSQSARNGRKSGAKRKWSGSAICGGSLTAFVLILVLVGSFVTPSSPIDFVGAPFEPPSNYALMGTDVVGRDVLSRVLAGGTVILLLAAISTSIGVLVGALLGICAGYARGPGDDLIMRILDVFLAFPQTILALLFVSILGSSFWLIAVLVAAIHIPQVARVIRAATLRVSREDFVVFARGIGTPFFRVVTQEILPNVLGPMLVETGLRFTFSIALIAGLSFLGLAQEPPAANWGLMVNENRIGLMQNPWPVLAPIALIAILTVGVNLMTDAYSQYMARPRAARANADETITSTTPSSGTERPGRSGVPE